MLDDHYLRDFYAQPETLERLCAHYVSGQGSAALAEVAAIIRNAGKPVCFTGMGASYFALLAARPTFDRHEEGIRVEDAGYLLDYGMQTLVPGQPIIMVSQSGRSVELERAATQLHADHPLIIITNDPDTALGRMGTIVLPLLADPDHGVAIKTYTATVALLLLLATAVAGGQVDDMARRMTGAPMMQDAIEKAEALLPSMLEFCRDVPYITLLGRGASIASALGGALLIKETAKTAAEGAHAGQFRHGAVEVVRKGTLVILFAPAGQGEVLNDQLIRELENYGARVMIFGKSPEFESVSERLVIDIAVPDEYLAPVFEVVPVQLLSHALASVRGIRPGHFVNTTPVITTM
jgi:glucosamine--fructose-6-phosphate aminotransferase (isomerizing)